MHNGPHKERAMRQQRQSDLMRMLARLLFWDG